MTMRIKIIKHYKGDKHWFYITTKFLERECVVDYLYKKYRGLISDNFKRIELIDEIEIKGIHDDYPKTLKHLTVNKWDVRDIKDQVIGL